MHPSQPSRRQLLTGLLQLLTALLVGLFGWLRPRCAAARPTPPPLASVPHPRSDPFGTVTTYTYDAVGRCTREVGPLPLPALASVPLSESLPGVTTCSYDCSPRAPRR